MYSGPLPLTVTACRFLGRLLQVEHLFVREGRDADDVPFVTRRAGGFQESGEKESQVTKIRPISMSFGSPLVGHEITGGCSPEFIPSGSMIVTRNGLTRLSFFSNA